MPPEKLVLVTASVVRVAAPRSSVPPPESELTVSAPPRLRRASVAMVSAGVARKRPGAPSVSAPSSTLTVMARLEPLSRLVP